MLLSGGVGDHPPPAFRAGSHVKTHGKLRLDFAWQFRLCGVMSDNDETCRELIRRLFYLVTVAAEDAATLAIEGQSPHFGSDQAMDAAVRLREFGERIKILSSAIAELGRKPG